MKWEKCTGTVSYLQSETLIMCYKRINHCCSYVLRIFYLYFTYVGLAISTVWHMAARSQMGDNGPVSKNSETFI